MKLVDTQDSKSCAPEERAGSSPAIPTITIEEGKWFRKIIEEPWKILTSGYIVCVYHQCIAEERGAWESRFWFDERKYCRACNTELPIHLQAIVMWFGPYWSNEW